MTTDLQKAEGVVTARSNVILSGVEFDIGFEVSTGGDILLRMTSYPIAERLLLLLSQNALDSLELGVIPNSRFRE